MAAVTCEIWSFTGGFIVGFDWGKFDILDRWSLNMAGHALTWRYV